MNISRRGALLGGLVGGVGACATKPRLGSFTSGGAEAAASYSCGVASGDPGPDSVVLWTRISDVQAGTVPVVAEVAEDAGFGRIVWSGTVETDASRDYTVKAVATGLEPGRRYAYRFRVLDRISPTGFTRTLPEQAERARFAVASCTNYPFGHFNAYDHIARQPDLDAVIHLGDYIYEYGPEGYGGDVGEAIGRPHDPPREITDLDGYRRRHRQYKSDPASQAMHAAHPLIAVWDDHETSNDAWQRGAENHQPATEGPWDERKRAALQAYYEYMPVREPQPGKAREHLYRSYGWGKYLTVTAIETRLTARSQQIAYESAVEEIETAAVAERFRREVLGDPARELLGDAQRQFVQQELRRAADDGVTWKILANQVLMARVLAPDLGAYVTEEDILAIEPLFPGMRAFLKWSSLGLPYNTDAWDGYPAARSRFYASAEEAGVRDLLVLTGDTHQFWANELRTDEGLAMGVELGTAGVTSPGTGAFFGDKAFDYSLLMRRDNPDVRYTDAVNNGYTLLELDEDGGQATFIAMSTVREPGYEAFRSAAFELRKRNGTVELGASKGLGFKERVLYR